MSGRHSEVSSKVPIQRKYTVHHRYFVSLGFETENKQTTTKQKQQLSFAQLGGKLKRF